MRKFSTMVLVSMLLLVFALSVTTGVSEDETPPYGGILTDGIILDMVDSLCVAQTQYQTYASGCVMWPLIYDQLWILGPAPDYSILPMLATSWETEDGQTWIFHLVEGAKWHDGNPVTAEDVAWTFNNLPMYGAGSWWYPDCDCDPDWGGSAAAIDTYTVNVTLTGPVSHPAGYWLPILPKHIWEPYGEGGEEDLTMFEPTVAEVIGSGPFKLKSWSLGEWVELEANEDYWGGRPFVDGVILQFYANEETAYAALKKTPPDIDMIGYYGVSAISLEGFAGIPEIDIVETPGIEQDFLAFNLHPDTPLRDLNVRKAILHSINRDEIIDTVFLGYGEKIDSFLYPELDEHNPNLPQYEYDVTLANELLDNAGYDNYDTDGIRMNSVGDRLDFDLKCIAEYITNVEASDMIREYAEVVGIKLTLTPTDYATLESIVYEPTGDWYEICYWGEEPGPLGDWIFLFAESWDDVGEGWNCAYYSNEAYDEAYWGFTEALDPEERKQYCYDMQMILAEDLPYAYLYRETDLPPVRTDTFDGYVYMFGGTGTWINPWTYLKAHKTEYEILIGDIDLNGRVNIIDISLVAIAFGKTAGEDPDYSVHADVDYNGEVNIIDIAKVALEFNKETTWAQ